MIQPPKSLLPAMWDVPEAFRKRLGSYVGRQRTMSCEEHLLLVLHAPPSHTEDRRHGRFFWRTPEGRWSSTEHGAGMESLHQHVDDYAQRVNEIDEQEDKAQDSDDYFRVLNELAPVQRAARNMYDVLCDARRGCPQDRELINVRDEAYALVRRIDLLSGHTRTSLEYEVARRVEQQAAASHQMAIAAHRLNLLAAFFFPMATLSSLLGMNVPIGLESWPWPLGIILVVAIGLLAGIVLTKLLTPPVLKESRR